MDAYVLGNKFLKLKLELDSCYVNKDLVGLQRAGNIMKEILVDLDYLTAGNSRCSIGKWIDDARAYGNNDLEKAYYPDFVIVSPKNLRQRV